MSINNNPGNVKFLTTGKVLESDTKQENVD